MLFFGQRWRKRPPADREGFSGYRTAMSRKNGDTWVCAHAYWGRLSIRAGAVLGVLTVLVLIWGAGRPEFETVVTALVFLQLAAMALSGEECTHQGYRLFWVTVKISDGVKSSRLHRSHRCYRDTCAFWMSTEPL